MKRTLLRNVVALFFGAFFVVGNSMPAAASDAVDLILNEARKTCKTFENGVLTIDMGRAVTLVDVTGDGELDEVVDARGFTCSAAASMYCGTGGCDLNVITDGAIFNSLAQGWSVRSEGNKPVLAIGTHWSACDYTSFCFEKFSWNGASFDSLGTNVEDPGMTMGLYDGEWVLQDFGGGKVTAEFKADGIVAGQAPCNKYHGTFELDYPTMKFGPIAATRMFCPDDKDETAFFKHLDKVETIELFQGKLLISTADGAVLTFSR